MPATVLLNAECVNPGHRDHVKTGNGAVGKYNKRAHRRPENVIDAEIGQQQASTEHDHVVVRQHYFLLAAKHCFSNTI